MDKRHTLPKAKLIFPCVFDSPQVFLFFCETCSVPICRECSVGRHMGHTFVYLQDAVQDYRAMTIQLLADAQQGRQAVQVRGNQSRNIFCNETGSKTNFEL